VIMGVLPGLKATGRRFNATLHELNGRTGTRLGPIWTTLVVAQIAVAVAVLPVAVYLSWQVVQREFAGPGFAAEQFVIATLTLSDQDSAVDSNRIKARQLELMSRLEAEPGVSAVTFSSSVQGFARGRRIEFDGRAGVQDAEPLEVSTNDVGVDLFDLYGARILAGRAFSGADLGAAHVVVNRTFERELLEKRDEHGRAMENRGAVGVSFRYARAPTQQAAAPGQQEWYQIIGVVRDFPSFSPAPGSNGEPTVYHPAAPGDVHPVELSVRFSGQIPTGVVGRFRAIGAEVDPAMQLRRVMPLAKFYNSVRSLWRYLAWGVGLVTMSVLLLSAAGIYALMSFTVAQRTREIGIRAALGAQPRQLILSIFGRVMRQLALGLLVGSVLSGVVFSTAGYSLGRSTALLLTVAALMLIIGLLAALGPARRSLRIQAVEALRTDG
jgi:putative ABC transport system permease protein